MASEVEVTKADKTKESVNVTKQIALIPGFGQTCWKTVRVFSKSQLLCETVDNASYITFLKHVLLKNKKFRSEIDRLAGWAEDEDWSKITATTNEGYRTRADDIVGSKFVNLYCRLVLPSITETEKFWPAATNVTFELIRHSNVFLLEALNNISAQYAKNLKVRFHKVELFGRFLQPNNQVKNSVEVNLYKNPIVFNFLNVKCCRLQVPPNQQETSQQAITSGTMPSFVVLAMMDSDRYLSRDPGQAKFVFSSHKIQRASVLFGGARFPNHGYEFESGVPGTNDYGYELVYYELARLVRKNFGEMMDLDYSDFKTSMFFLPFDPSPCRVDKDQSDLQRQGAVAIDLRFFEPVGPNGLTVLAFFFTVNSVHMFQNRMMLSNATY